jgi:adenine-specific DNA-methyltransferase
MNPATLEEIRSVLLEEVPGDGSSVGNGRLRELIGARLQKMVVDDDYARVRDALVASGVLVKGQGRGGSVRRAAVADAPALTLEAQEVPAAAKMPKPKQSGLPLPSRKAGEPTGRARQADEAVKLIAYQHDQKRTNNPEVGMVTPESAPDDGKTRWAYDPHLDPALQFDSTRARFEKIIDDALESGNAEAMREALAMLKRMADPYLNWAGKAERTSFEIDTVSLHVHERIDPSTILTAIRKRMDATRATKHGPAATQADFFRAWFENPLPYREAIEFYKHDRGWSNRLIAGDSLLVMNSLLQKEGMAGRVQMIYIDPPYGIKYGSNFQPFVNKRDVKDRSDADLTQEPEMIKAFRDTWELGIHSYLTYLRDRLLLARELLAESGSVFVQISDENLHHVRELMDEVLSSENFVSVISFKKTSAQTAEYLSSSADYLIWYARKRESLRYNALYVSRLLGDEGADAYTLVELEDSQRVSLSKALNASTGKIPDGAKAMRLQTLLSAREGRPSGPGSAMAFQVPFNGRIYVPSGSQGWKTTAMGLRRLAASRRAEAQGNSLAYVRYIDDFPAMPLNNLWMDTQSGSGMDKQYVVAPAEPPPPALLCTAKHLDTHRNLRKMGPRAFDS